MRLKRTCAASSWFSEEIKDAGASEENLNILKMRGS